MAPCEEASVVRESSAWVSNHASHVFINQKGLEKMVEELDSNLHMDLWDFEGIHYFDDGPLTVQYLFVLDALNFCFWPDAELHYDHLATGLRSAVMADKCIFDADRLMKFTGALLCETSKDVKMIKRLRSIFHHDSLLLVRNSLEHF